MPRLFFLLLAACATSPVPAASAPSAPETVAAPAPAVAPVGDVAAPVHEVFPPPSGATRLPADAFGSWLQERRVHPASRPVRTHDGRVVSTADRVVELPLVRGDLQQCADTAIRLRAEWLRERGDSVVFHATSGDALPWERYANGEVPYESNGRIAWKPGSDRSWDGYLRRVFTWAGSASLERLDTARIERPIPGSLLVEGGFPGHVVVLFDVAVTPAGETYVLVGEGFMPAQDLHIQVGPHAGWWRWEQGLQMPHWAFEQHHLRAFTGPAPGASR